MYNTEVKTFTILFDDHTKDVTRHTNIDEVKKLYLNQKVRKSNGEIATCIGVFVIKNK